MQMQVQSLLHPINHIGRVEFNKPDRETSPRFNCRDSDPRKLDRNSHAASSRRAIDNKGSFPARAISVRENGQRANYAELLSAMP